MDIIISLLHSTYRQDQVGRRQSPSYEPQYPSLFRRVLKSLWVPESVEEESGTRKKGLDAKDRTFTKFLIEVPEVTEEGVEVLKGYCGDGERFVFFCFGGGWKLKRGC